VFGELVRELRSTEQQLVSQLGGVRAAIAALEPETTPVSPRPIVRKRGTISAKGRAAISRAQKLRWAKIRAAK